MGMRYKVKVLSNLEITINKIHNLAESINKNLVKDKEQLIQHLRILENDMQIINDMIEKEDAIFSSQYSKNRE